MAIGRRLFSALAAVVLVVAAALPSLAQITVTASVNTTSLRVGESVVLTIRVEGSQSVGAPALQGLDGFAGRYVGPSSQVSIVNGTISASVDHRYRLTAQREGQLRLGPFRVEHEGQTYETKPILMQVAAAGAPPRPQGQGAGRQTQPGQRQVERGEGLRFELQAPRRRVYLHERVPVDVVLMVGSVKARDLQFPTLAADGVSVEEFSQPARSQQVIDGQRYEVLRFRTHIVPVRSGTRTLGPAKIGFNVVKRPRNFFFTQRQPVELASDAVEIEVLPLPSSGRPGDFSGAVGRFSMTAAASPREVRVGDPVTVQVVLRGEGNLGEARITGLSEAKGFKVYDPQTAEPPADVLRIYEQVLIPEDESVGAIPPVRFSFFDPADERYRRLETAPIPIQVLPAESDLGGQIVSAGSDGKVRMSGPIGSDIVYIKDDPGALFRREDLAASWWWLLLWVPVPFLLYVGAVLYDRRRLRLTGDERYARFTRAGKQARRALGDAEAILSSDDPSDFLDRVEKAVREYFAAKLALPPGGVDAQSVAAAGVDEATVALLREFFEVCEQARFAPSAVGADRTRMLEVARTIVRDTEKDRSIRLE